MLQFFSEFQWILLTAAAVNAACAIAGSFLILRRMSLMGDALSHAVLPGLVVALLISGSQGIAAMFVGAIAVGLLTTYLIQTLHQYAKVPSDASMGIVFTSLFALGVILVKKFTGGIHFDVACVYEGALEFVPFAETVGGLPRPLVSSSAVLALNAVLVLALWKEFKISSFDPALASTMGYSANWMHYLLMTLVAITAIASFEAVGSVLVIAMLIVPASTAHLLTDRLGRLVIGAILVGLVSALVGCWAGVYWDTSISGMITLVAGAFYFATVLVAPKYGILSALVRNLRMSLLVVREDLLAMLYRLEELQSSKRFTRQDARVALGNSWLAELAIRQLLRKNEIRQNATGLELTDSGRQTARSLVRSHRLWETYLVEYLDLPLDHVHEPAHRVEHYIDSRLREEIAAQVETVDLDPHGRHIPE